MNVSNWNIYSTRNYCTRSFHFSPKCTKIVSGWGSAPDPARGAYSAPPDPLAVMGWDGDLVTTLLGCKLCAPSLVAGAPLLFWGWLRAWVIAIFYLCRSADMNSLISCKRQDSLKIFLILSHFSFYIFTLHLILCLSHACCCCYFH